MKKQLQRKEKEREYKDKQWEQRLATERKLMLEEITKELQNHYLPARAAHNFPTYSYLDHTFQRKHKGNGIFCFWF